MRLRGLRRHLAIHARSRVWFPSGAVPYAKDSGAPMQSTAQANGFTVFGCDPRASRCRASDCDTQHPQSMEVLWRPPRRVS